MKKLPLPDTWSFIVGLVAGIVLGVSRWTATTTLIVGIAFVLGIVLIAVGIAFRPESRRRRS